MAEHLMTACQLPPAIMVGWPEENDAIPDILLPFLVSKVLTCGTDVPAHVRQRVQSYQLPSGIDWSELPVCREIIVPVILKKGAARRISSLRMRRRKTL